MEGQGGSSRGRPLALWHPALLSQRGRGQERQGQAAQLKNIAGAVLSTWQPLATAGYWALEMWPVRQELKFTFYFILNRSKVTFKTETVQNTLPPSTCMWLIGSPFQLSTAPRKITLAIVVGVLGGGAISTTTQNHTEQCGWVSVNRLIQLNNFFLVPYNLVMHIFKYCVQTL